MTDDTHTWDCQDCPKKNPLSVWKCICGYARKKPAGRDPGTGKDRRFCSYISSNGRQCPLPGDMADAIGPDVPMWCSGHLKIKVGPEAEKIFQEALKAPPAGKNDLMAWWEAGEKERRAQAKAPPIDEAAETERRRKEAERIAEEARQSLPKETEPDAPMAKDETHISEFEDSKF